MRHWLASMSQLKNILVLVGYWASEYTYSLIVSQPWKPLPLSRKELSHFRRQHSTRRWTEQLDEYADELSLPALKNIKVLAVEDEQDALEEMVLGFPGLRDGVEYQFYLPEGCNIPRKVRK